MDAVAEIIRAAEAAAIVTAEANDAPPLVVADPEAATGPGEHEPTRVGVIAGRVKLDTPPTPKRKSQR